MPLNPALTNVAPRIEMFDSQPYEMALTLSKRPTDARGQKLRIFAYAFRIIA